MSCTAGSSTPDSSGCTRRSPSTTPHTRTSTAPRSWCWRRRRTSLSALLSAHATAAGGPALLTQICEGLVQLHRAGWVHADLKPANVLLMKDGSARLADFDMAGSWRARTRTRPRSPPPTTRPRAPVVGDRRTRQPDPAVRRHMGVRCARPPRPHRLLPAPRRHPSARRDAAAAYARGAEELRLSPELPDAWREIVRDCLVPDAPDASVTGEALLRRVGGGRYGRAGGPGCQGVRSSRRRRSAVALGGSAVAT